MQLSRRACKFVVVNVLALSVFFLGFGVSLLVTAARPMDAQSKLASVLIGFMMTIVGVFALAVHWLFLQGLKAKTIKIVEIA